MEDEATDEELAALFDQLGFEEVAAFIAAALQSAWQMQVQVALQRAVEAREGGSTPQEVIGVFRTALTRELADQAATDVRDGIEVSYRRGFNEVTVGPNQFAARNRASVSFMQDYSLFWVRNHYDSTVQERIRGVGADAVDDGLGAFRSGRAFADSKLGQQFSKSQSYWELLSNAVTTRTRELSHVDKFIASDIDEVMIDAVLDARTSCICRTLDGTRIPVSALEDYRDELVNADSPAQIKETSPWLSCEEVQRLESQGVNALVDQGIISPPYHGHCRSRLSVPL